MKYILLGSLENRFGHRDIAYEDIITGAFAEIYGIENYRCEDRYCWPVFELGNGTAAVMEKIHELTEEYCVTSPPHLSCEHGSSAHDSIRRIYEALIPRELRHALGEYYTPGWLAEMTLGSYLHFGSGSTSVSESTNTVALNSCTDRKE